MEIKKATEFRKQILKALDIAVENQDGVEVGNAVKYSLSVNAKDDVRRALTDFSYTYDVKLTDNSPSIITSQKGTRNLPMVMKPSHIRENVFSAEEAKNKGLKVNEKIHYHGLGEKLFLDVIKDLEDVSIAYRGTKNAKNPTRRENYFILISEHKDNDGNTINVPVYIDEQSNVNRVFIETNKVATVFGKSDLYNWLQNQVNKGNLVRIKNRNIKVSEHSGTSPEGYNNNVSTNSISDSNENVKKSLDVDTDGNKLSAEQQEYFADSKIRDENGNLLVVYHGTDANFTIFDKTKTRANMDIQGNFFSPWKIDAEGYGSKVNAYYLNIKKPAPEGVAYKALNRFKGQNYAGVKAREYLEKMGYDGINNGNEEYIAFYPEQIKLV